jgi:hypothetical protein
MAGCKLVVLIDDVDDPVTLTVGGAVKDQIACDLTKRSCSP